MFPIFSQKVGFYQEYQWSNKPLLIFKKLYSFGTKKQENILQLTKSTKFLNSKTKLVYRNGWTWWIDTKNSGLCQKIR